MAATAFYQNRERAFNRTNRIHQDLNRASAYILDTDSAPISSSYSLGSARSSSLTRDAPRYVDPSNAGYRFKDRLGPEVLRRSHNIPIQTSHNLSPSTSSNISSSATSSTSSRQTTKAYPKDFNPYSETARFKREQEMKDIHEEFMKTWDNQRGKLNNEEKKTKAYHKIMGTAVSALEDRDYTRQTIGDIFKDMNTFSTKTVAALSTLDSQGPNKNKNYNWRKEIEKYETTGQLERDARIRNIEIRNKRSEPSESYKPPRRSESTARIRPRVPSPEKKTLKMTSNISRIAHEAKIEIPVLVKEQKEPQVPLSKPSKNKVTAPKEEEKPTVKKEEPSPVLSKEESSPVLTSEESCPVLTKEKSSPVLNKRTKVTKVEEIKEQPSELPKHDESQSPKPVESNNAAEVPAENVVEEDEDANGTKKMKDEFSSRMASLDAEMTQGRSNLARIRERIRKAKQGLMEIEI
eukprot:TRINITY_DN3093_c0_g2_i1.p1 TRINITY_DN3093_c0_g2~~TRINITY_DN3093_c0_g2_i1.p1  ORF type:complete len:486 (-),score=106.74 TRINITY_DN3093_c0_g2_i1:800-2191(-)